MISRIIPYCYAYTVYPTVRDTTYVQLLNNEILTIIKFEVRKMEAGNNRKLSRKIDYD